MLTKSLRSCYVMGTLIALFLLITAGAGLFVEDIYEPFLSENLIAFQYFQDFVSLIFAPILIFMMIASRRGSVRAFVIWAGILVYVLYYYSFFGFDKVYTFVFPLYLALMGLAAYSLIGLLTSVDPSEFRSHISAHMPVRFIAVVLGMTILFVPLWLVMLSQHMAVKEAGTTDTVFVLDLAFLIPAILFTVVQLWQRRPIGYLLSGVFLFKATISGILLTGGSLQQMALGLQVNYGELGMYIFLATAGTVAMILYLRNIRESSEPGSQPVEQQLTSASG